jgi:hypothetical protein
MERIGETSPVPQRRAAPAVGSRQEQSASPLGAAAYVGNHALAGAFQRIGRTRRLQRYTITHADAGEAIWAAIKHLDPDEWDQVSTRELAGAKLQELLTILEGLGSSSAEAAKMAREIRAEHQEQQDRPAVSPAPFSMPKLSVPMLVARPKAEPRPPGELGQVWESDYRKQPRSYAGKPEKVREELSADGALLQLYKTPAEALDAIGWNALAERAQQRSSGVEVRIEFLGADRLLVNLSFPPAGARDTTITYTQDERLDLVVLEQRGTMRDEPAGIMKELWEHAYGKAEQIHTGEPEEVRAKLLADPVLKVLFKSPEPTFFNIIGWPVLSMPYEQTGATTVTVKLAFEGLYKFTVHTTFPWGMQDTTLYYGEESGNIVITEVYRHRSEKTVPVEQPGVPKPKDLKPHLFADMIKHQALGVADLGPDVAYISKAIKSDEGWGYNVWPKMGFDAVVSDGYLDKMRADEDPDLALGVQWLVARKNSKLRFSDLFTVQDPKVYRQLGELWRRYGDTVEVSFDARPGSASWRTLEHYKKMRS